MEGIMVVAAVVASATAAAGAFAVSFVLLTRADVGAGMLVAAFVAAAWVGDIGVFAGSLYVSAFDLICPLLGALAVVRWSNRRLPLEHVAWLALGALIVLSLLLGVRTFGLGAAGNEARALSLLHFWCCAAYFASFDWQEVERRCVRVLVWGAATVAVLVLARWALELAGIQSVERAREAAAAPFRVVASGQAMFLAAMCLVLLRGVAARPPSRSSRLLWALAVLLILQVLLLQHRSVWLATLAGLLMIAIVHGAGVRKAASYAAFAAVPLALVLAAMLLKGALDGTLAALTFSVQNEGTLSWRVEGWNDLLVQWRDASVAERLLGEPFGGGFGRYMESLGAVVRRSPHNAYLVCLLRVGVLGAVLFLLAYAMCFVRLAAARRRGEGRVSADALICVLAAQLVYFLFYNPDVLQAVFLGAALAACRAADAQEVPLREPLAADGR